MTAGIDVGRVIAGKFELVRLLGRGSMGEVWVAHHRTLGEHVALKLLTSTLDGEEVIEENATAAARFRFEAQIAARLSRKTRHIVRVTDHGEEDGLAYLVMELLEGQTLDSMLESGDGRQPVEVVADAVTQISRALTHAHAEGVFHRDLKPANVFVSHDEEGRRLLKVLDFGIARAIHAHRVRGPFATAKGLVFGTPGYMSPEQALASEKLDHRCDLWALSVIAYEALSGRIPTEGVDVEEILKNLCAGRLVPLRARLPRAPEALGEFFARAFADRIENRYSSASELATDFAKAAGIRVTQEAVPTRLMGAKPSVETTGKADMSQTDAPASAAPDETESTTNALRPRRRAKVRVVSLIVAGAAIGFTVLGLTWRALSQRGTPDAVAPSALPVAASGPGPRIPPAPPPQVTEDEQPSLAVSSLPHAPVHPLSAARGPVVPMVSSQPPSLTPASPASPPPAAPRPAPKPHDKSDVL